jgi:hypothetical protein
MTGTLFVDRPEIHAYTNGKESAKEGMRFPNMMFVVLVL